MSKNEFIKMCRFLKLGLPLALSVCLICCGCVKIPKEFTLVNGQLTSSLDDECKKLYLNIQKQWAVQIVETDIYQEGYYFGYYHNKRLIKKILDNESCFVGMDTSQVIALLGKPNRKSKNGLSYQLVSVLTEDNSFYGDHNLFFRINYKEDPKTVSAIGFGTPVVLY